MEPSWGAATSSWQPGPSAISVMPAVTHREEGDAALAATDRKRDIFLACLCALLPQLEPLVLSEPRALCQEQD